MTTEVDSATIDATTVVEATDVVVEKKLARKTKKVNEVKEKKKTDPKKKTVSSHPSYEEMIKDAIVTLNERTGSSQYAIQKFIEEKHKVLPPTFRKLLLQNLERLVAYGKLTKVNASFKLPSASATSAPTKKKSVTVAVPKPKGKVTAASKAKKSAIVKPKTAAAKKETVIGGSTDIISTLPDALICHILSFLSTKQAASTSVLAKRWKLLFAFVPDLDFDSYDFLDFHPPITPEEMKKKWVTFRHFVDKVLALRRKLKVPVNRFHLECLYRGNNFSVTRWISEVLKRDVLDIDLHTYFSRDGLPSTIFVSKTLVKLKIVFLERVSINIDSVSSLPKLKTLHLDYFLIEINTFIKLLSGCHALEELELVDLKWDKYTESGRCPVTLSIPTLEILKLSGFGSSQMSLSFDIPNLVYLEYCSDFLDRFQQLSFESLVEAVLYRTKTDKITVTKLFMGIRNVKILYLSDVTLETLDSWHEAIPVFDNLLELTVHISSYAHWKLLPHLLKNCPSLQTLVFRRVYCKNDNDWRVAKMDVCTCLSSSKVKVIKILNLEEKYDSVKLFLETMPDLEQMILYYDYEDVMEVFKKLEKLPRVASGDCHVQLKSYNLNLSSSSSSTCMKTNINSAHLHSITSKPTVTKRFTASPAINFQNVTEEDRVPLQNQFSPLYSELVGQVDSI